VTLICLDFETFYDPPAYGLKGMTTEEYIRHPWFQTIGFSLKVNNQPAQWYTGDDAYMASVLRSIDWGSVAMCGHNNRFDAAILNWRYGCRPKRYIDTMSMARGLVGLATSCSLEKLGEHFDLPLRKGHEVVKAAGKRREDFSPADLAEYGRYCVNDTEMTYLLLQRMLPHTLSDELKLQDWTIRAYAEPKLVLDEQVLRKELAAFQQRRSASLAKAGITDIAQLRSDDTFARALQALGVDPPRKFSPKRKNADGSPMEVWAFSKQDVEFMELLEDEDEAVVSLVEARLGAKSSIIESRLQRFIGMAQRGPMPMPMLYAGATPTRRWSGDDSVNVQNMPRNKLAKGDDGKPVLDAEGNPVIDYSPLRRAICAPPGMRMAAADLSQIELRVNAWQSGQTDVLEILRTGGDVYSDQASALYGYEVTKKTGKTIHQVERFVGKTTELQCGYQCGAAKFLHSLKVAAKRDGMVLPDTSEEFGRRIVDGYRQKRAKIRDFWRQAEQALQHMQTGVTAKLGPYTIKDHRLWLPNGSYLYYPNLRQREKEDPNEIGVEWVYDRMRKGRMETTHIYGGKFVENITQACARLFVSDALLRLETLKYPDGRRVFETVFMVHDELVVLFDERLDDEYVVNTLKWAMTTNPPWAPDLPLDCEVGIATNYAECK
jgi:hypothetical protein